MSNDLASVAGACERPAKRAKTTPQRKDSGRLSSSSVVQS